MVQIKYLLALAPFALLALADDTTSDNHSQDNSQSHSTLNQGAYFGGCGTASKRNQINNGNYYGNSYGGGSVQGITCARSEHAESDMEARDIDNGFKAMELLTARDDTSSDDHSQDNSVSTTTGYGGAWFGGCRRSHFFDERDSINNNNHYGGSAGGSVQGITCARSEQLALRDVGGMYRRMQARSFTEDQADEAADMLRRHAEHLGLIKA